jgi:hypothetical protein
MNTDERGLGREFLQEVAEEAEKTKSFTRITRITTNFQRRRCGIFVEAGFVDVVAPLGAASSGGGRAEYAAPMGLGVLAHGGYKDVAPMELKTPMQIWMKSTSFTPEGPEGFKLEISEGEAGKHCFRDNS